MGLPKTVTFKVYTAVLGIVATIVTQKLISGVWKLTTGDEPPTPADPDTPFGLALSWSMASGLGIGMVQLITHRYTARRIAERDGEAPKKPAKIKFRV